MSWCPFTLLCLLLTPAPPAHPLQGTLGRARPSLLQWLLDAMDPRLRQAPGTRAKAVKALGDVVAAQEGVLAQAGVQAAVEAALADEAVSVRDAAVGLLGRHVSGNPALALSLFNTLAKASAGEPGRAGSEPANQPLSAAAPEIRRLLALVGR